MTSEATRDPLEMAMFAAWVNVPVDKVPNTFRAPTCADTMAAWKRVGEAAVEFCDQSIAAELATLRARLEVAEAENARLRGYLVRIENARSVFDGGSINECRQIARKGLKQENET